MRMLYKDIYIKEGRGFSIEEFVIICSQLADKDMTEFFDDVVYSLKPLNYEIFNDFGLDLLKKKRT